MSENLAGMLLVAVPTMLDPNFHRTVVLVCEHNEDGALGLILNRPTTAVVEDYLPGWLDLVPQPAVVFEGGPVQREVAIGLGRSRSGIAIAGWTPVTDRVGLVDLSTDPGAVGSLEAVRVFSGYAGWSTGQLEAELDDNGWFVVPSSPDDGFASDPPDLWSSVLKRQRGPLAIYAYFPLDPSVN